MTKPQHTPGPWKYEKDDATFVIFDEAREMDHIYLDQANDEREANAKLIAAAPELLAACLAVVESCDLDDDWQPWAEQCRAAIYKATGSEQ